MPRQPDHEHWLRLTLCPGVGPGRQRALLSRFGLPSAIAGASRASLGPVIGDAAADALVRGPERAAVEAALTWAEQPDHHLITLADANYPRRLLEIADPPVLLYALGNPAWLSADSLAVVGARSATPGGCDNARAFARHLAGTGLAIISGLASGIDAAAHRGALDAGGGTIAVIGTGIDRVYPARNRALAHEIAAHGLILSELPLGTSPRPHHFPRRNRLIAGLALGVLVVEAALESGSLITARLAADSGREVFAIPGSIHSPLSRGCHRLIRDGAKLVEDGSDIAEELAALRLTNSRSMTGTQPEPIPARPTGAETATTDDPGHAPAHEAPVSQPDDDDAALQPLLDAAGFDPFSVDELAGRTGLTVDKLYAMLIRLELDGVIHRAPGGRFERARPR